MVKFLALGVNELSFKIEKSLGGKSANELIILCKILSFKIRFAQKDCNTSSSFIGRVNHAILCQYAELIYL